MSKKIIWIIENNESIVEVYKDLFEERFELKSFPSFIDFLYEYKLEEGPPDCIIADYLLEDGHFLEFLEEHKIFLNTPFIMISGVDDTAVMENAFNHGAFDYILKPINRNELLFKIHKFFQNVNDNLNENWKTLKSLGHIFTPNEFLLINHMLGEKFHEISKREIEKIFLENHIHLKSTIDELLYDLKIKLNAHDFNITPKGPGIFELSPLVNCKL